MTQLLRYYIRMDHTRKSNCDLTPTMSGVPWRNLGYVACVDGREQVKIALGAILVTTQTQVCSTIWWMLMDRVGYAHSQSYSDSLELSQWPSPSVPYQGFNRMLLWQYGDHKTLWHQLISCNLPNLQLQKSTELSSLYAQFGMSNMKMLMKFYNSKEKKNFHTFTKLTML